MAAVKYELFCRYYNADMKMPITNITDETWHSAFEDNSKLNKKHVSIETFEFMENADIIVMYPHITILIKNILSLMIKRKKHGMARLKVPELVNKPISKLLVRKKPNRMTNQSM